MIEGSTGGDVVIIGAGLIGLATAFELAERGATVRVYDRGEPGRAASWAGAGMLTPYAEAREDEALLELCATSLREYPAFVERVRAGGGIDSQLRLDGVVHAAFDEPRLREMLELASTLRARGVRCESLARAELLKLEPWLGWNVTGGLFVADEGCIDNRRLGRALAAACTARGVVIGQSDSLSVECDARRVLGVRTHLGYTPARAVVNACGAWAAEVDGVAASSAPPIAPVKGQMLALAMPRGFVSRPTWLPGAYLVPRDDGRLLVGATSERVGFDVRVTARAIGGLLDAVLAVAPALGDFAISETWAGLRPATPDERPILGETPTEGLFLATGHYRNGILLAPATARLIADVIEGKPAPQLRPFKLDRFGTEVRLPERSTLA